MESVQAKPSFRQAWRQAQYAVLLIDDFFEPCYETGVAVRHRIQTTLNEPFGVACLWDRWSSPHEHRGQEVGEKSGLLSFTMLTLNADQHPVMSRMHPPEDEKRMPWVLVADQFEAWLNAVPALAQDLVRWDVMPTLATQADPRLKPDSSARKDAKAEKKSTSPDQLDLF
jgi:putative SOS response-associated peptidase YedK